MLCIILRWFKIYYSIGISDLHEIEEMEKNDIYKTSPFLMCLVSKIETRSHETERIYAKLPYSPQNSNKGNTCQ